MRFTAALAVVFGLLLLPTAANAQSTNPFGTNPLVPDPGGTNGLGGLNRAAQSELVVDVVLRARGNDAIELRGTGGEGPETFATARAVGIAFGLDSEDYDLSYPYDDSSSDFSEFDEDAADVRLATDRRLVTADGDQWTFTLNTRALLVAAGRDSYQSVQLRVCPSARNYTVGAGAAQGGTDDCPTWTQAVTVTSPVTAVVDQRPTTGTFHRVLTGLGLTAVVIAALGALIVVVRYRKGRTRRLSGGLLAMITVLTVLGVLTFLTGLVVMAVNGAGVNDYLLAQDYGTAGTVLAYGLPPLLPALAFVLLAAWLSWARPRSNPAHAAHGPEAASVFAAPAPAPAAPNAGLPSWLSSTPSERAPEPATPPPPAAPTWTPPPAPPASEAEQRDFEPEPDTPRAGRPDPDAATDWHPPA